MINMVKKGVGKWQIDQSAEATKAIMEILIDGEWYRYQEIKAKSGLSSATLSKHLKELERGIVEKEMRLKSGEYPYPVLYRLKAPYQKILSDENDSIAECCGMGMMKVTPFDSTEDSKECLKITANALSSAVSRAYQIYLDDKNWTAFQQTMGTANSIYYNALQNIFKKE
jgi:DNA-binding transcriptional ArsR family regulator